MASLGTSRQLDHPDQRSHPERVLVVHLSTRNRYSLPRVAVQLWPLPLMSDSTTVPFPAAPIALFAITILSHDLPVAVYVAVKRSWIRDNTKAVAGLGTYTLGLNRLQSPQSDSLRHTRHLFARSL